jgi:HemY protein
MADIEEAETGDQARVRYWLSQALRAPRDPEWVADGQVSPHWLPISPVTGRLDAFEWKRAREVAPNGTIEDHGANKADAAFRMLPDVKADAPEREPQPAPPAKMTMDATAVETPVVEAAVAVPPNGAEHKPQLTPVAANDPDKPFFGRAPDDPGVKTQKVVEKNGFKLF